MTLEMSLQDQQYRHPESSVGSSVRDIRSTVRHSLSEKKTPVRNILSPSMPINRLTRFPANSRQHISRFPANFKPFKGNGLILDGPDAKSPILSKHFGENKNACKSTVSLTKLKLRINSLMVAGDSPANPVFCNSSAGQNH